MKTLKEKFGKFELSNTQAKNVAGGTGQNSVDCWTVDKNGNKKHQGTYALVLLPTIGNAGSILNQISLLDGFIGCF